MDRKMTAEEASENQRREQRRRGRRRSQQQQYQHGSDSEESSLSPTPVDEHRMIVVRSLPFNSIKSNESNHGLLEEFRQIMQSQDEIVSAERAHKSGSFDNLFPDFEPNLKPAPANYLDGTVQGIDGAMHFDAALRRDGDFKEEQSTQSKKRQLPAESFSSSSSSSGLSELSSCHPSPALPQSKRRRAHNVNQWNERYEELCEFHAEYGHCRVPVDYEGLSKWVKRQRYQHKLKLDGKHSTMTDERVRMLEAIGFAWSYQDEVWQLRFDELCEFASSRGHCNVPSDWPENYKLSVWVKCQRRQYRIRQSGTNLGISLDRIEKLESIGFQWSAPKQSEK